MDLKELDILGDHPEAHWYYRAKSAAMRRMLAGAPVHHVLDVGAGSGFFARQLLEHEGAESAVCVDPNYPAERQEFHAGKPISFVRAVSRFDGDLVLLMDVLEHVPDDTALLGEYAALTAPGTRFLITVPALAWMWSGHDVFLEHYRRYTIGEVDRLVARAGLHLLNSTYYFGATLPLAAARRLPKKLNPFHKEVAKSDMRLHSPLVNNVLWRMSEAELAVLGRNRVAGLSVFALAEKK
jgi:SAM-dependent methyltransferase